MPPELGYPENDFNKRGPRPTTFSVMLESSLCNSHVQLHILSLRNNTDVSQGQRALDFVLRNQGLIDKTLLFDIELLKIIPN